MLLRPPFHYRKPQLSETSSDHWSIFVLIRFEALRHLTKVIHLVQASLFRDLVSYIHGTLVVGVPSLLAH